MESYVPWSQTGDHIFEKWWDAFGNCSPGNGNNTGATLTENADPVLGGIQSMKYEFDNDGTVYSPCTMGQESGHLMYSRIEAPVAILPSGIGTDWTVGGVKALYLGFHGLAGNPVTEPLWVQLKSGGTYGNKVFYGAFEGESLDDFNEASWHDWYIDLADFGVNLSNVIALSSGSATRTAAALTVRARCTSMRLGFMPRRVFLPAAVRRLRRSIMPPKAPATAWSTTKSST
jgi:hypothetical protein